MINGQSILAIIPARDGSKRLPGKNIKILGDKPLIAWTIIAAQGSSYIDRIIVTTDSEKIAKVSKDWSAEIPFKRPNHLAQDNTTTEEVAYHALCWIKNNESLFYDYFIFLQPTSPLRTKQHIDEAIERFDENRNYCDKVVSVYKLKCYNKNLIKNKKQIKFNESVIDINKNRKEKEYFFVNGAIYFCTTQNFLKDNQLYFGDCIPYIMDRKCSLDIDTEEEFKLAKEYCLVR